MSIKLLDYRAIRVNFIPTVALLEYFGKMQEEEVDLPSISYMPVFPEQDDEEEDVFLIHFRINITPPSSDSDDTKEDEDKGIFQTDFIARFLSIKPLTQEFKDSNFPKVNAPAIAYPFIRAFVNNFFINAGYDPVLLPTYNFTKSVQEIKK